MNVMIIEDDPDISDLVAYNLQQEKFKVKTFENGLFGLKAIQKEIPDLVILDLMLPDMGGVEICREIRSNEKTREIPVIMLTAKSDEIDRIVGFEVGADDYMTKPFSARELMLRVKAVLKRVLTQNEPKTRKINFGKLTVDIDKHQVNTGKKEIILTAIEFKLLVYLLKTKGRVATRDSLLNEVWGYDAALTTRTVDTHIKRLRQKLGLTGDYIETIRGIGYRFKEKL